MKNRINKNLLVIVLSLVFSVACKAQTASSNFVSTISGTWVIEGNNVGNKWVFHENGILQEYSENVIETTYNWSIEQAENSGVISHYLKIVNPNDISDAYDYEINALTSNRMVLVYLRRNNMGIGKPIVYIKQ